MNGVFGLFDAGTESAEIGEPEGKPGGDGYLFFDFEGLYEFSNHLEAVGVVELWSWG